MSNPRNSADALAACATKLESDLRLLREVIADFDPAAAPRSVSSDWIRSILRARRRRDQELGAQLFGEPAWDILLVAYAWHLAGQTATITEVCREAAVPGTTGLRWIGELEEAGFLTRKKHRADARRVLIGLTASGLASMDRFFSVPRISLAI